MTDVVVHDNNWDGENLPTVYIDFLGQECRVGDYVAYATSNNHSANVAVGKVLEFRTHNPKGEAYGRAVYDYDAPVIDGRRQSTFQHTWQMKIQPVLDSRIGRWGDSKGNNKAVQIGTIMNVHKVDMSFANYEVYE